MTLTVLDILTHILEDQICLFALFLFCSILFYVVKAKKKNEKRKRKINKYNLPVRVNFLIKVLPEVLVKSRLPFCWTPIPTSSSLFQHPPYLYLMLPLPVPHRISNFVLPVSFYFCHGFSIKLISQYLTLTLGLGTHILLNLFFQEGQLCIHSVFNKSVSSIHDEPGTVLAVL